MHSIPLRKFLREEMCGGWLHTSRALVLFMRTSGTGLYYEVRFATAKQNTLSGSLHLLYAWFGFKKFQQVKFCFDNGAGIGEGTFSGVVEQVKAESGYARLDTKILDGAGGSWYFFFRTEASSSFLHTLAKFATESKSNRAKWLA